jgi:hypothetical protein
LGKKNRLPPVAAKKVKTDADTVGRAPAIGIFEDSDLTIRTKGTLLMKMVRDFVSSKLHSQPQ